MLKLFIAIYSFILCPYVLAVNPVHIVFRADDRELSSINNDGGMWPWREGQPDNDLAHHFEGESIEGHSSNFVSTTASLRIAVIHAASLARPNSEEPFDEDFATYIYQIRPADNFYSVDEALITARDSSPQTSLRRERLTRLINDYTGMEEFVAQGGFSQNRIIAYARLTGDMLRQYYSDNNSPLFTQDFWSSRWIDNTNYDNSFDNDTTTVMVYANVDNPRGYVSMVMNGTQPVVPISFTCMGVHSSTEIKKGGSLSLDNTCSARQYLTVRKAVYDSRLILLRPHLVSPDS